MFVDLLVALAIHSADLWAVHGDTTLHRLRTTDPIVTTVIREAIRRSPTFASLVDTVEASDTFVYIVRAYPLPHDMEGCLVHEGGTSPRRYLKVLLAMGTPRERMIVVLAHELQHVREVLDARISIDPSALAALFKRIGTPQRGTDTGEQYETKEAQDVMTVVARELATPRRTREP